MNQYSRNTSIGTTVINSPETRVFILVALARVNTCCSRLHARQQLISSKMYKKYLICFSQSFNLFHKNVFTTVFLHLRLFSDRNFRINRTINRFKTKENSNYNLPNNYTDFVLKKPKTNFMKTNFILPLYFGTNYQKVQKQKRSV